ncbi:protein of unknown function [Prosthecobacter debontii]|uniref:3-keto-alpha-glucoside-1,2-lyase/3-keto-2-hydroxy-glucal hydratase domain-containing protein n=1 Tax=Prosthecobacter debontii TaxID=48467 RepID=A0A1T4YWN7_9BACT|nr:DUF1080 domain-containing protein [Prosthecobacter debontii]SKB06204.1 protein of unknown function [Prosthecobacter debontii]
MKTLVSALLLAVSSLTMAQEPQAAKTEWVLFDGKDLKDWETVDMGGSGEVSVEGGQLIINQGESLSGVVYKKVEELPLTNYEITLQAKRLQGVDFFCGLTFPVGDLKRNATLICGGWGGSVTGISSIDGMDAANNATGTYQRYDDDKWYSFRLRVTPENLSVWVDDKQVVDQDIKDRKVSLREGPIELYAPLSLTTYNTTAAIKNVRMKTLPVK